MLLATLWSGNLQDQYRRVLCERPDAIVFDLVNLREQDGWRSLQLVNMQPRTAPAPIVACTAAVERVKELGAPISQ